MSHHKHRKELGIEKKSSIRIIIGGPPNSGKSTFAVRITRALQDIAVDADHKELDLWSQTIEFIIGNMTKEDRDSRKRTNVTTKEVTTAVQEFKSLSQSHVIAIGDGPGRISKESEMIFKVATHGIIVCKEDETEKIDEWKQFFKKIGVRVVVIIVSKLNGDEKIISSDTIIEAEISGLDRKPTVTPIMLRLAHLLKRDLGI